ncbi:hypothetical protein [Mucilaginibacter polytrichastri]|uniref:Uncharacterized protein n=1 Tax=Mucilaginibacter polytrichastri TaxID=1302689 RepID=A0A1Q6A2H7_9SPHI|nr:hypothetical protein [Mucilaginibacter polytrichastri]OKS88191.1 hypothetical protein RG47T_3655 [Mucilaginibacter polytrichastri]SFT08648.1 hypothetical protein SAMN04487890_11047 [Mucilaginibacter polytrichastri]
MDLQHANGADVKNAATKENNNVSQNATAKATANAKPEVAKPQPAKPQEPAKDEPKAAQEPPVVTTEISKPVLTLETKLRKVDELHRKSVQRLNLISRIKQLEAFEVNLAQENDELEDNPYQGCRLIIEDDKKRQFITTTPGLIRLVSQFIYGSCNEKLVEIEDSINFPNA